MLQESGESDGEECTSHVVEESNAQSNKKSTPDDKERKKLERKMHKKAVKLQNREKRRSGSGGALSAGISTVSVLANISNVVKFIVHMS